MSNDQIHADPGEMNNLDRTKLYVIGFSGGKDSVATWLHLQREMGLDVVCTFSDTSHESPVTYDYLRILERDHNCPLVWIQPILGDLVGELQPWKICWRLGLREFIPWSGDDLTYEMEQEQERFFEERGIMPSDVEVINGWQDEPLTMERLAILKRRFPSSSVRFCTTFLKLIPQRRWLHANFSDRSNVVRVAGVRAQESRSRASRPEWSDVDEIFGCPLWLPIHKWSHDEVFEIHGRHGIPPNPLYMNGCGRVGCFPCINATKGEIAAIDSRYPEALVQLGEMEDRVSMSVGAPKLSFFSKGKTPNKYASHVCSNSGERFPDAEDVRRWATGELPVLSDQILLFEEDWTEDAHQCLSQYGLCE